MMIIRTSHMSVAIVLCIMAVMLSACGKGEAEPGMVGNNTADTVAPVETIDQQIVTDVQDEADTEMWRVVETAYMPLRIADEYTSSYRHMEVSDGGVTMEVFYMLSTTGEKEVFRIYFGDANMGDPIGTLETGSEKVLISVDVCSYSPEDFASEDDMKLYSALMGQLNTVLDSIRADSRFVSTDAVIIPEMDVKESNMSYWNVMLPKGMEIEETETSKCYQADFYGIVSGEKNKLYTIYLGEVEADTLLGTFLVGEEARPVYVKNYDLQIKEGWSDEDITSIYNMMATINDVIQVIMNDKNFSEEVSVG